MTSQGKPDPILEAFIRGYRSALKEINADMLAALKEANAYMTLVEGKGEGGTSPFDVAAEAVRTAIAQATDPSSATE